MLPNNTSKMESKNNQSINVQKPKMLISTNELTPCLRKLIKIKEVCIELSKEGFTSGEHVEAQIDINGAAWFKSKTDENYCVVYPDNYTVIENPHDFRYETTNCIICQNPAKVWTGHVLYGSRRKKVTAGWCRDHVDRSEDMSLMKGAACYGEWKPEYGMGGNK